MTAAALDHQTMLDWALHYARAGFEVFPVSERNKAPLVDNGFKDATSDHATITAWWTEMPNALIGCRVPLDVVILDIDPRHGGDGTWAELQHAYGPIPEGREHRSGRGDDGKHLWFRRPEGHLTIRTINEWARDHNVGHATGKRSWSSGIDILHHDQRYTILPPSLHPETRRPYTWASKQPPATMPGWLVNLLTTQPQATQPARTSLRVADSDSIADWYSQHHTWNDILGPAGWELVDGDGDSDGSKWRHPNATASSSCSIRHGCLFVYTPNTDFEQTEEGDRRGYTRFRAWATLEHDGDLRAAALAAREMRDGPRTTRPTPPAGVDPYTGEIITTGPLDRTFWQTRPYLQHIHQAALSRMVAPAAVLGCVLARVAAFTPPSSRLPALIGSSATLGTYVALYARSGGGKSSATGCAGELLPVIPAGCIGPLPLGSGEGLIDAYFELVEDTDGGGKKRMVKRQTRRGALFILDEGQVLAEMGNRRGSTVLPILRSAWSGSDAGQANASIETRRILRAGTYSIGLVSLWQAEAAARLIEDADGGTPQRFAWFDVTSSEIDADTDHEWPGPLDWTPPAAIGIGDSIGERHIDIHPAIRREVRRHHAAVVRGEREIDPLDAHRNLAKLKVAAILGLLDGRHDVNEDDWQLAERIMEHSDSVRTWVLGEAARKRQAADEARTKAHIGREAAVEESAMQRALTQGARAAHRAASRADGGVASRRQIGAAIAYRVRQVVTVDDVIAEAERLRWIVPAGPDGWKVGDAAPR